MFIHIGNGVSIKKEDVIGIFDLDNATLSKSTKEFLNKIEREGLVEYNDFDLPRSFILFSDKEKEKIKLSRISSSGLKQRINESPFEEKEKIKKKEEENVKRD